MKPSAIAIAGQFLLISSVASQQPKKTEEHVAVARPRTNGQLDCAPDAGGLYRCSISGTATKLSIGRQLLLWVRPVQPPSDLEGWYLQRRPNGILSSTDTSWTGKIQIGNRDYPPHDGDLVDVAVSIGDKAEVDALMKETGVVTRPEPPGGTVMKATNVRLRILVRR
jgi:hypothetical protein